ncbi:MAG TPA: ATP-binding protein [Roseiarcus sp.]|nr:ATP-binding protein [Roseiarcus sp.]
MDPRLNPYAPGAGAKPPALAGRDALLERAAIALDRIRSGRAARGLMLYGLRGVGKTVLLNEMRLHAEAEGVVAVSAEAPEQRSLPALLAPALRQALLRLSRLEAVRSRALGILAAFAKALKLKYADVEVNVDVAPVLGVADSGDLEHDLTELLIEIGRAAKAERTAFALFIDELQYVEEAQLGALIAAIHQATQSQAPIALIGAGLPQLLGLAGRAKSYSERLFEFVEIDRLAPPDARAALCLPAEKEGIRFEDDAVAEVLAQTQGYPYFLQEWGKHCWDAAPGSPITLAHARTATERAIAELDASFFRVRFDRLTPQQKTYLRAMAELGAGPYRSGDVAERLGRDVTAVAPTRHALIAKGMAYSPAHGDIAFTVPLFDEFMRRSMSFPT